MEDEDELQKYVVFSSKSLRILKPPHEAPLALAISPSSILRFLLYQQGWG